MRLHTRRRQKRKARSIDYASEWLEPRLLLSISSTIYGDPLTAQGNSWTYETSSTASTVTGTVTQTVGAPATDQGQPATEVDTTSAATTNGNQHTLSSVVYVAQTSQGLVEYEERNQSFLNGVLQQTDSQTYATPSVGLPATLDAGMPVTETDTEYDTDTDSSGNVTQYTDTNTEVFTLQSDTPQPVNVKAGTFDCYQVTENLTTVTTQNGTPSSSTTTNTETLYLAQGVGLVEMTNTQAAGSATVSTTQALDSFTGSDRLVFNTGGVSNTQAGEPIKPAFTVSVDDSAGNPIIDATGTVTLTPAGVNAANPITGNTAALVDGVATFSDVVLSKSGTYQLQASDTAGDTVATSNKFGVGGDKLKFSVDPESVDVGDPITVKLEAITSKGKIDSTLTDTIQLGLNVLKGASNTVLHGTVTATLVGGVATFAASAGLSIDDVGTYTLTATPMGSDGVDYAVSSATSESFQIKPVTAKKITAELNGQKAVSTDDDLAITNSNVFAALQTFDLMSLQVSGLSPSTSKVLSRINWTVERNSDDEVTGALPILTQDPTDPLRATITMGAVGSFNVICYYDSNDNGSYDAGEEVKVFHLAEVAVNVLTGASSEVTDSTHFSSNEDDGFTYVNSGNIKSGLFALTSSDTVQVVGGGPSGMIGVDGVHVGFVQNGTADTAQGAYQNNKSVHEVVKPLPVLDSSFNPSSQYPDAIYALPGAVLTSVINGGAQPALPGPTRDPVIGSDPAGGEDRDIQTADAPAVGFKTDYFGSTLKSITGVNSFNLYLSAYSDDFNQSYMAYEVTAWTVNYNYMFSANGPIVNNGSTVTETLTELPTPADFSTLRVRTTGPRYTDAITYRVGSAS